MSQVDTNFALDGVLPLLTSVHVSRDLVAARGQPPSPRAVHSETCRCAMLMRHVTHQHIMSLAASFVASSIPKVFISIFMPARF